MSALSDALAELAAASAKVAALSGNAEPTAEDYERQAAANERSGVVITTDGPLMAKIKSGRIAHDAPEVLAALENDRKADAAFHAQKAKGNRLAEGRAEAQRRFGKGKATGTATDDAPSGLAAGRAEAQRRFGKGV